MPVTTRAGIRSLVEQLQVDPALPTSGHTEFRGQAARLNYLAADRIGFQFAGTWNLAALRWAFVYGALREAWGELRSLSAESNKALKAILGLFWGLFLDYVWAMFGLF